MVTVIIAMGLTICVAILTLTGCSRWRHLANMIFGFCVIGYCFYSSLFVDSYMLWLCGVIICPFASGCNLVWIINGK